MDRYRDDDNDDNDGDMDDGDGGSKEVMSLAVKAQPAAAEGSRCTTEFAVLEHTRELVRLNFNLN